MPDESRPVMRERLYSVFYVHDVYIAYLYRAYNKKHQFYLFIYKIELYQIKPNTNKHRI